MAKRKSSNLGLVLKIAVLVLGVAAFCMAFVVSVKFVRSNGDVVKEFTGFQAMSGYTENSGNLGSLAISTEYLAFSFMSTLTFVLPLVGAVLSLMKNKIVRFVGAGLMIAGAVLMFFVPSFTVPAGTVLNNLTRTLGIGAILGGVFAGLGGLVAGYSVLTNRK